MQHPNLIAKFELDESGQPARLRSGNTTHYKIRLGVESPPDDTYAVTYRLHDSYYDPIRESRDKGASFEEKLTSYGDYQVRADVRTLSRVESLAGNLSEALRKGHQGDSNPAIIHAIDVIERR
jgi:hypothetical protein